MTRDEAAARAQVIANTEGVAVYVCTKKRGRGSWLHFTAVRAEDAKNPWHRDDRVLSIVRPVEVAS